MAGTTAGPDLIAAVAFVLICYGAFCIVSAPRRQLNGANDMVPRRCTQQWWRSTWPLGVTEWARLVVAFLAVVALFTSAGVLLTRVFDPNPVTALDVDVARSFVQTRTDQCNELACWGAFLSATSTKVVLTFILGAAAALRWRRWHDGLLIALSLTVGAAAF